MTLRRDRPENRNRPRWTLRRFAIGLIPRLSDEYRVGGPVGWVVVGIMFALLIAIGIVSVVQLL